MASLSKPFADISLRPPTAMKLFKRHLNWLCLAHRAISGKIDCL